MTSFKSKYNSLADIPDIDLLVQRVDTVESSVSTLQTDIGTKMPKSGGTFTGTVKIPTKQSIPTNSGILVASEYQLKAIKDQIGDPMPKTGGTFTGPVTVAPRNGIKITSPDEPNNSDAVNFKFMCDKIMVNPFNTTDRVANTSDTSNTGYNTSLDLYYLSTRVAIPLYYMNIHGAVATIFIKFSFVSAMSAGSSSTFAKLPQSFLPADYVVATANPESDGTVAGNVIIEPTYGRMTMYVGTSLAKNKNVEVSFTYLLKRHFTL
jgi:hypothetical protein